MSAQALLMAGTKMVRVGSGARVEVRFRRWRGWIEPPEEGER